jgi:hypothetical protein
VGDSSTVGQEENTFRIRAEYKPTRNRTEYEQVERISRSLFGTKGCGDPRVAKDLLVLGWNPSSQLTTTIRMLITHSKMLLENTLLNSVLSPIENMYG